MTKPITKPRFPYLPAHVEIYSGQTVVFQFDIEALVDTGFDGGLTIPRDLIPDTIPPFGRSKWKLADETEVSTLAYFGYVSVNKLPAVATLIIVLGEDYLLGRNITNNFLLTFDRGIKVSIEP